MECRYSDVVQLELISMQMAVVVRLCILGIGVVAELWEEF